MNNTVRQALKTVTQPFSSEKPKTEKPLDRRQRRIMDRFKKEVEATYRTITGRFMDYLMSIDEASKDDIERKATLCSAQWITFCKAKGLNEKAYDMVSEYCKKTSKQFLSTERVSL